MPVAPYTWQLDDWLSASRLMNELSMIGGQAFAPNGIRFHAMRPVWKSNLQATLSPAGSTWTPLGKNDGTMTDDYFTTADTAGMFGARMDPSRNGTIRGSVPSAGGIAGSNAGLGLLSAFPQFGTGTGSVRAGIGQSTATTPVAGMRQDGNASFTTAPWALDIVDLGLLNGVTGFYYTSQGSPSLNRGSLDGSGQATRMGAHWLSVYPANGATVASLPSLQSTYTSSTPLTAALMNANIAALMNLLNMPPLLRVTAASQTTAIATGTPTALNWTGSTPTYDTYSAFSGGTYTAPLNGLYLAALFVPYESIGATYTKCALQVRGQNHWGPANPTNTAPTASSKIGIFDLNAGDTISAVTFQNSGSNQSTSSSAAPLLIVLWLGALGAPATMPQPPDPTFAWQAGTPQSAIAGLLTAQLGAPLSYLLNRPYLLSYQATAQGSLADGTSARVHMDTLQGISRATAGDPWNGWNGTNFWWVAPRNGWYLVVQETFVQSPNASTASVIAMLDGSVAGASSSDFYGGQNQTATNVNGGGASAIGYYYLRAGDAVGPRVRVSGGGTQSTYVASPNYYSHFECVWLGE